MKKFVHTSSALSNAFTCSSVSHTQNTKIRICHIPSRSPYTLSERTLQRTQYWPDTERTRLTSSICKLARSYKLTLPPIFAVFALPSLMQSVNQQQMHTMLHSSPVLHSAKQASFSTAEAMMIAQLHFILCTALQRDPCSHALTGYTFHIHM